MVNSHQDNKDEKKREKKEVQSFVTDKWNTLS